MKVFTGTLVIGATLAVVAMAVTPLVPEQGSAVWLVGDSTLHPFTCKTNELKIDTEIAPQAGVTDLIKAITEQGAMKRFNLTLPVESLKSDKEALDKNMYKALKSQECSTIDFKMTHYEVGTSTLAAAATLPVRQAGADNLPVRATGILRVACQEQTVTLNATLTVATTTALRVKGQYALKMTRYGVKPPKMMMGTIKVKDDVMIHYDLKLALPERL